ncbi:biotin-dependent carboxyltransferase family protein [Tabrizicola sp.]|uniref:5-oxoprolinase subunit C family protein n=1 Tax=Tabrizicola sp. TaxID=2005166 RepID=UPI002FDDE2D3
MTDAILSVAFAGPHVTVQDTGRPGLMRFGVPASGPMDRLAFAAANLALGNPADAPAIEVSRGGLVLACLAGEVGFAVAGGGFILEHDGVKRGSWTVARLRQGETLAIRPGPWGSWCYLAIEGRLACPTWLGHAATHSLSGLGGGRLATGQRWTVTGTRCEADEGAIPCPVFARPRHEIRVTLGPQDRFFAPETVERFLSATWEMTDAWDRMGVRLKGPGIAPAVALDMPSEPVLRGSVQVAGDGVASILLADHQTTGGYPKIATVLDCDLDAMAQLRPRDPLRFTVVSPVDAIQLARTSAQRCQRYLAGLSRGCSFASGHQDKLPPRSAESLPPAS